MEYAHLEIRLHFQSTAMSLIGGLRRNLPNFSEPFTSYLWGHSYRPVIVMPAKEGPLLIGPARTCQPK